ncbi:hypothetical protein V1512DRAFT_265457 [Lipomyces arxii]|uniref:uncharacterized protein n=1 Tax=Lipomyces arxii TaxID=56418 RepID=UPI0034CFF6B8
MGDRDRPYGRPIYRDDYDRRAYYRREDEREYRGNGRREFERSPPPPPSVRRDDWEWEDRAYRRSPPRGPRGPRRESPPPIRYRRYSRSRSRSPPPPPLRRGPSPVHRHSRSSSTTTSYHSPPPPSLTPGANGSGSPRRRRPRSRSPGYVRPRSRSRSPRGMSSFALDESRRRSSSGAVPTGPRARVDTGRLSGPPPPPTGPRSASFSRPVTTPSTPSTPTYAGPPVAPKAMINSGAPPPPRGSAARRPTGPYPTGARLMPSLTPDADRELVRLRKEYATLEESDKGVQERKRAAIATWDRLERETGRERFKVEVADKVLQEFY